MDELYVTIDDVEYLVAEEGLVDEEGNVVFEYNDEGDVVNAEGDVIIEADQIEEAHDMKDAEAQSVQASDKAEDGVKGQAPARKGDKRNGEKKPQTLAGKIGAMYDKMKSLSKEDLDIAYEALMGEELYEEPSYTKVEDVDVEFNYDEDLNALVESEATLSDDFKEKASVIFETAIKSHVAKEIDRLETEYENNLSEAIEEISEDIVEKVDNYLNYVVENWMQDNEVAIEQGLRTEIAEDFMTNLRGLFEESYIEVPESKVDLVDELADRVEELEEQLDNTLSDAVEMSKELEEFYRIEIVREHASGLADTEVEKLLTLVDEIDFEDTESFNEKVKTIKETYFKKGTDVSGKQVVIDENGEEEEIVETSEAMDAYIRATRKTGLSK